MEYNKIVKGIRKTPKEGEQKMTTTEYKGYGIDYNFYGEHEYSVQYCGDDMMFRTIEDAKAFIDEITK